jgi:hypothetical protein
VTNKGTTYKVVFQKKHQLRSTSSTSELTILTLLPKKSIKTGGDPLLCKKEVGKTIDCLPFLQKKETAKQ